MNQVSATTRFVNSYSTLTSAITASVDGDTISLTADIVVTAQISLSKSLVFTGNKYTVTVPVPGVTNAGILATSPSTFRVFSIAASGKTIVFNNMIIKGGSLATSGGAMTIASGSTVRINYSTISNSRSVSGGGIFNQGTCYIYKTGISRNAADYGGGFLNSNGTLFLEASEVIENRSLSASGGGGGCENNGASGNLYVNNSSFSNNQSTELGGAVNNLANAYIASSSFTGNVAYGAYKGGAIAQNAAGKTMHLVSCLFAYNYYNNSSGGSAAYTLDDMHAFAGTISLYYTTYMASSVSSGTVTLSVGNNLHLLAANGSTNDLFTGGSLTRITDASGTLYGTNNVFRPFLVNIGGYRFPTLRSGSYALARGTNVGFTNGNGTPVFGFKNLSTNAWTNIVGANSQNHQILNDESLMTRAAIPASGSVERLVDNYAILTVNAASNGTVNGASIYGEVYPSGTSVQIIALPNAGYAFSNWTYNLGGTGTSSANPLNLVLTQNTTLTPSFASSTNYTITYVGNNNTSGSAPAVSSYGSATNGTVSSNSGGLARTGYTFAGWNTSENGSGTTYSPGATYTPRTNVVLYSLWTSEGIILPVTITQFSARATANGKVTLNWQTEFESNSERFVVQRATNCSGDWETVAEINAAGFSAVRLSYSATDNTAPASACYRLKSIDRDGTFKYSSISKVSGQSGIGESVVIFPNPARGKVTLSGVTAEIKELSVFNSLGQNKTRQVKFTRLSDQEYSLDISHLTPGIYLLKTSKQVHQLSVY